MRHGIEKGESWRMFDEISPRYDFLNRILSLGQDLHWRRELVKYLSIEPDSKILDLATGTADVPLLIMQHQPFIEQCLGIDLSERMIDMGRKKVCAKGLDGRILLRQGDAHAIPALDNSFTAVTIAFGIRNMASPQKVLQETFRVLKKGGRVLILEFSLPTQFFLRKIHLVYLRRVVPLLGYLFAGNYAAYKYLNETIEEFPSGQHFLDLMTAAGFRHLHSHPLFFGAAVIYQGDKPDLYS